MSKTFFISDVHLTAEDTPEEKEKEKKLLSFLKYFERNGERLIIVGDLFDFWFEYRTVIPRGHTRLLCALLNLKEQHKELHYVTGNHDFWMRDFLSSEFKMNIHQDNFSMLIDGKKFFIFHGDGTAKNDRGYRILKKIFRNKTNIFLYSLLHPDIGIPFAKWISSLSRKHTDQEEPPDDSDYLEKATQLFGNGFDYVLCGHLHYPKFQTFGNKIYVNLGDWINHFTYGEFENAKLNLKTWNT